MLSAHRDPNDVATTRLGRACVDSCKPSKMDTSPSKRLGHTCVDSSKPEFVNGKKGCGDTDVSPERRTGDKLREVVERRLLDLSRDLEPCEREVECGVGESREKGTCWNSNDAKGRGEGSGEGRRRDFDVPDGLRQQAEDEGRKGDEGNGEGDRDGDGDGDGDRDGNNGGGGDREANPEEQAVPEPRITESEHDRQRREIREQLLADQESERRLEVEQMKPVRSQLQDQEEAEKMWWEIRQASLRETERKQKEKEEDEKFRQWLEQEQRAENRPSRRIWRKLKSLKDSWGRKWSKRFKRS